MGKEMERSSGNLDIKKIVQDPGLRPLYLGQSLGVYGELWRRCGVPPEDIQRNSERLSATINRPDLPKATARVILSVFELK